MSGWTKLFSSIVTSSVWCESDATVRVWIAMLATADADGHVEGSVPGFANLARVSVAQMRAAVVKLSSPDPDSRTPDREGRRIEVVEGGWRVLNYAAYRERGQEKEGSRAPYFRRYRKRRREEAEDAERNIPATPPATDGVASNTEERSEKREGEADGKKDVVATTTVDRTTFQRVRCPDCHAQGSLRKSRTRDVWFCGTKLGGCDSTFPLDHRALMVQLDQRARTAIETRVARTRPNGDPPPLDADPVRLALDYRKWVKTSRPPEKLDGQVLAHWLIEVKGIKVPSPLHMAIKSALEDCAMFDNGKGPRA